MLTEKDYCDYETCVALKKLGYNEKTLAYYTSEGFFHWIRAYIYDVAIPDLANSSNKKPYKHIIDAMSLYEAQKWLRKEKNIIVEVFVDDDSDTPITYNIYKDGECVCHHHGKYWSVKEWSEALSEGIKEAVKILKEK